MTLTLHQTDTPLGTFTVLAEGDTVYASGFTADASFLAGLAGTDPAAVEDGPANHPALKAVDAYFAGDVRAIDAVKVRTQPSAGRSGAPFRTAARDAMREIPTGSTRTYTELAATAGNPNAVRAAGSACATNPVSLFVPCHRVLRSDGSLGGYLYGLDVKRALLDHERRHAPAGSETLALR